MGQVNRFLTVIAGKVAKDETQIDDQKVKEAMNWIRRHVGRKLDESVEQYAERGCAVYALAQERLNQ